MGGRGGENTNTNHLKHLTLNATWEKGEERVGAGVGVRVGVRGGGFDDTNDMPTNI